MGYCLPDHDDNLRKGFPDTTPFPVSQAPESMKCTGGSSLFPVGLKIVTLTDEIKGWKQWPATQNAESVLA
jgi:hypothetical protein